VVLSAEAAEMAKLADNLWIDANIALAHELALLCAKLEIDVLDVIRAANSLPKGASHVNILTPSVGVGGYCLTKDPWFVDDLGKRNDLELRMPATARRVNDAMPRACAHAMHERMRARHPDRAPADLKIAILGIAFKNDTGDCRFSPTKPFIEALDELGYRLEIFDPLAGPHDACLITARPLKGDLTETLRDAAGVAMLAAHRELREIPLGTIAELAPGTLIFDGRRYFSREEIERIGALGLDYLGVGR
jgi:UDP-N-acetyl-D-mannosaminuronic acid dehydrogenase